MSRQLRKNLLDLEPTLLPDDFEPGTLKHQKLAQGLSRLLLAPTRARPQTRAQADQQDQQG